MSASDSVVEITASTVDEAIKEALERLGAGEDDVVIEILATPRSGVLGLGVRSARVRVSRRARAAATSGVQSPPPAPPPRHEARAAAKAGAVADAAEGERKNVDRAEQSGEAIAALGRILELMGEKAEVIAARGDDPDATALEIKGDGSGILIGRHGQTLDALEYLVNRLLARKIKDAATVVIDCEQYRARRRHQLQKMALAKGEQAKRERVTVTIDPMPPRDRRIIHLTLKDDPMITTRSAGEGFLRAIEIVPAGGSERRERGGESRERGQGREREREREPIGQQGGFKHGQKRIV